MKATAHTLEIGSQCTISGPNEIAGDPDDPRSLLAMGPACWLLPHCYVNVAREIRLGRNVGVGGGSYLFTHGLWLSKLDGFPVSYGSITIKDDVWLPWGCFIMPGVMIGSGAIIGARSVVNKSLPAGVLAAGVPAKVLRDKSNVDLTPDQRAKILEEISSSLAESRRTTLQVECDANSDTHLVGGEPVLVLHKPGGIDRATLNPRVLNVTYDDLDTDSALATPSWSLVDYRSSPFAVLPATARDWLAHARIVGVRFYPIDEDPI